MAELSHYCIEFHTERNVEAKEPLYDNTGYSGPILVEELEYYNTTNVKHIKDQYSVS